MIDCALHLGLLYLVCAPERTLVWWAVAVVLCLGHAGRTLTWFRREHAVQGYHAPKPERENRTHTVDQRRAVRV